MILPAEIWLRAAVVADAPQAAALLIASRQAFISYAPMAHSPADVKDWMEQVLIPSGGVVLACEDDQPVGLLALSGADGVGWIDQLYVAPGRAGQGIGTLLLAHALAVLPRPVRLHTFQANYGARRFYERHGFMAIALTDGRGNEEQCPDVLYELPAGD